MRPPPETHLSIAVVAAVAVVAATAVGVAAVALTAGVAPIVGSIGPALGGSALVPIFILLALAFTERDAAISTGPAPAAEDRDEEDLE